MNAKLKPDSFEGSIQEAFEIYNLMNTMADNGKAEEHLKNIAGDLDM